MRKPPTDDTPSFDFDGVPERQTEQAVNLLPSGFDGSSPSAITTPAALAAVSCAPAVTSRVAPSGGGSGQFPLVPQALFLSWSPAMQLAHCAARDFDSAESAPLRGEDPWFYLERGLAYHAEMEAMK